MDLMRMKFDVVNDDGISAIMKKTNNLLNEKKSDVHIQKMYTSYQNLWTEFVAKNNVRDR